MLSRLYCCQCKQTLTAGGHCVSCLTQKKDYYLHRKLKNLRHKHRNIKYMSRISKEKAEKYRLAGIHRKKLLRLAQKRARGELIISLICQVWGITPEQLKGRIYKNTPEDLRVAKITASTLMRRQFHVDAIADLLDIASHDVRVHSSLFNNKYAHVMKGDILILDKINKVRDKYREQKSKVNRLAKKSVHELPGYNFYWPSEIKHWRDPIKPASFPKGIDLESLKEGVSWFLGVKDIDQQLGTKAKGQVMQVLCYLLRVYQDMGFSEMAQVLKTSRTNTQYHYDRGVDFLSPKDEESLFYELDRVFCSKQRYIVWLAWLRTQQDLSTRHEVHNLQRLRSKDGH